MVGFIICFLVRRFSSITLLNKISVLDHSQDSQTIDNLILSIVYIWKKIRISENSPQENICDFGL